MFFYLSPTISANDLPPARSSTIIDSLTFTPSEAIIVCVNNSLGMTTIPLSSPIKKSPGFIVSPSISILSFKAPKPKGDPALGHVFEAKTGKSIYKRASKSRAEPLQL